MPAGPGNGSVDKSKQNNAARKVGFHLSTRRVHATVESFVVIGSHMSLAVCIMVAGWPFWFWLGNLGDVLGFAMQQRPRAQAAECSHKLVKHAKTPEQCPPCQARESVSGCCVEDVRSHTFSVFQAFMV